jgi:hypothetical protein
MAELSHTELIVSSTGVRYMVRVPRSLRMMDYLSRDMFKTINVASS